VSFRAVGTLRDLLVTARRVAARAAAVALSRAARAARALSAVLVAVGSGARGAGVSGGRVVDGAGVGDGSGGGGDAHAIPENTTPAIRIERDARIYFANLAAIGMERSFVRCTRAVKSRNGLVGVVREGGAGRTVTIASIGELNAFTSRRGFLRLMGLGGAVVLLPGIFAACEDSTNSAGLSGPGTGTPLTIDFANGDVAVLQFALLLEEIEAAFYSQVVANFVGSTLTPAEQAVLVDIRNHEVLHREALKAVLGAASFTISPILTTNFKDRVAVLAAAKSFEELGVAAYNGAAQYFTSATNLLLAGKIVSVEARHASAIRDLITPLSGDFAPSTFDDAFSPTKVAGTAQQFIVDQLAFANTPPDFVQGPNGNG
jgi:Ferritin-like domain